MSDHGTNCPRIVFESPEKEGKGTERKEKKKEIVQKRKIREKRETRENMKTTTNYSFHIKDLAR